VIFVGWAWRIRRMLGRMLVCRTERLFWIHNCIAVHIIDEVNPEDSRDDIKSLYLRDCQLVYLLVILSVF
jgi:hypothetical protein